MRRLKLVIYDGRPEVRPNNWRRYNQGGPEHLVFLRDVDWILNIVRNPNILWPAQDFDKTT